MNKNKVLAIKVDAYEAIREQVRKVYLAYQRPFIIGFSGGKDSTLALQITWEALIQLPREQLQQDVHIITTDTLIEQPFVVKHIHGMQTELTNAAKRDGLPFKMHILPPNPDKTFWVNLIGRGYPAPSQKFRWCTDRLKIDPVSAFVNEYINRFGEVTILLGARKEESASRAQVINKQKRDALGLSRHSTLLSAYVFTPIQDLTTDEVWQFLLTHNPPWGGTNRDLAAMYQSASGECPLVMDASTPSCGQSRFGCWTCTLVQRDTSMENLIDSGEEWMRPLLEFRNLLCETQRPENKLIYRDWKRRTGRVDFNAEGKVIPGPYKFEWRQKFLQQLLVIQKQIRNVGHPEITIISSDELERIRSLWKREKNDWEDSVVRIYREVLGEPEEFTWVQEDSVTLNMQDNALLNKLCDEAALPHQLVAKLIDAERAAQGQRRSVSVINQLENLLRWEWRELDEVKQEMANKRERLMKRGRPSSCKTQSSK